jgi:hypothetical protein
LGVHVVTIGTRDAIRRWLCIHAVTAVLEDAGAVRADTHARKRTVLFRDLEETEVHFYAGLDGHGLAVLGAGLELPFVYGLDGFLIQA